MRMRSRQRSTTSSSALAVGRVALGLIRSRPHIASSERPIWPVSALIRLVDILAGLIAGAHARSLSGWRNW